MATLAEFRTRFPEFGSTTDDRINLFLGDSEILIPTSWGDIRDLGIYYLTAHNLAVATKTATGNTAGVQGVQSKSVEGVSVTYQSTTISEDNIYYASTSYGKRYLELKKRLSVGNAQLV